MNRILTLGMHFYQFRAGEDIPNGACLFFSIARAADTSLGSFGFNFVLSISSDFTGSAGVLHIGLTAGLVCLRVLVAFAPARNESEILDCEEERETAGAMLSECCVDQGRTCRRACDGLGDSLAGK